MNLEKTAEGERIYQDIMARNRVKAQQAVAARKADKTEALRQAGLSDEQVEAILGLL